MAIYATAIIPVILMLVEISLQGNYNTLTTACADELNIARPISQLKKWRNELCKLGPKFGYYSDGINSRLVTRKNTVERAECIFKHTKIKITSEGQRHLRQSWELQISGKTT